MAIQMGKALAFTAVSGMVAGLAACGGSEPAPAATPAATPATGAAAAPATDAAKHACKGQNSCKGLGG
jgi:hypothetical protein